jgi:glycosyltransferase involved in cell wall biosynthesis
MSRKLKIAVVAACPFPYARGTPIRILRMSEALAARGHEVHVVTYHLGQIFDSLPFQVHRIANVSTYQKVSPGPTYQKIAILDTLLVKKLFALTRQVDFDIIHAHHFEGLLVGLPVARLKRIPIVFDVHTLLSSELPHYSMGLSGRTLRWLGNLIDHQFPHRADHIVSVTNLIREKLINEIGIDPEKVTTIYGGVEMEHFSVRDVLPSDTSSPVLIYTGNLAPYQGVDLMLRAFRKILDKRPDVKLKIVTNSSMENYRSLVSGLGLRGQLIVEDANYFEIPGQLYASSVALNPRVHCDGLPLKLLNYMATGRPVVSFEGSAEALEHERTGLVVPNGDIDGFAQAVLRLLEDSEFAGRLGQNAQSVVQEFFVWENSVRSLETIYDSLLARRV